jgi:hypothetical protein
MKNLPNGRPTLKALKYISGVQLRRGHTERGVVFEKPDENDPVLVENLRREFWS